MRNARSFLHLIDAGFYSSFACIGYFGGICGVHYSILLVPLLLFIIDVRGSMKLVKLKDFFVVLNLEEGRSRFQ